MNTYQKLTWMAERANSFHLTHNRGADYYETVEEHVRNMDMLGEVPEAVLKGMIDRDEIWELQVYPSTPIGSYTILHWDLEQLVGEMYETTHDELLKKSLPPTK